MPNFSDRSCLTFVKRQQIDKAIHTLEGILKGIAIDEQILPAEYRELEHWCDDNHRFIKQHPFLELIPKVKSFVSDKVISKESQTDVLWLCRNLSSESIYYDQTTTEIQILQGILHGILSDGEINEREAHGLKQWMDENAHLQGFYPFDELDSLLTVALRDGRLDLQEQKMLLEFFEDFVTYSLAKRINIARKNAKLAQETRLSGICAITPSIEFPERTFCFTGASRRAVRREIAEHVIARQGLYRDSVVQTLNYLVVGASGNPCWAFSCYGRKVEEAVNLRKEGHRIVIVHENDFWDAIADSPI